MIHLVRADDRIPLTSAGREQLQAEIVRVEARMQQLLEMISQAQEDRTADDDERAAAFGLLDDLGRCEARLAELRAIVQHSVDAAPAERGRIGIGSVVRVKEDDGAESVYTVVNPAEAAAASGRVSVDSPLGQALTGHRAGDEVTVAAPAGSWDLTIVAIEDNAAPLAA